MTVVLVVVVAAVVGIGIKVAFENGVLKTKSGASIYATMEESMSAKDKRIQELESQLGSSTGEYTAPVLENNPVAADTEGVTDDATIKDM